MHLRDDVELVDDAVDGAGDLAELAIALGEGELQLGRLDGDLGLFHLHGSGGLLLLELDESGELAGGLGGEGFALLDRLLEQGRLEGDEHVAPADDRAGTEVHGLHLAVAHLRRGDRDAEGGGLRRHGDGGAADRFVEGRLLNLDRADGDRLVVPSRSGSQAIMASRARSCQAATAATAHARRSSSLVHRIKVAIVEVLGEGDRLSVIGASSFVLRVSSARGYVGVGGGGH